MAHKKKMNQKKESLPYKIEDASLSLNGRVTFCAYVTVVENDTWPHYYIDVDAVDMNSNLNIQKIISLL